MRVAVTGASGFVGGWIVRTLAERGHVVHAFGRRPVESLTSDIPDYHQWDIAREAVTMPQVDAVVHCAAHVGHWGDEAIYRSVNVDGTRRVLDAFREVEPFVYVSTSSVYESGQRGRLTEDTPAGSGALTAYGRTKAEAERIVASSGRRSTILRPHIVYGPGDTTLLPRLLSARRLGHLLVPGDGTNRVSVTHVLNLAYAVERALLAAGVTGVFNIADAEAPTVRELLSTTFDRLALPTRLLFVPRPLAWAVALVSENLTRWSGTAVEPRLTRYVVAHLADYHILDISRAREALGYEPRWGFRDAWPPFARVPESQLAALSGPR